MTVLTNALEDGFAGNWIAARVPAQASGVEAISMTKINNRPSMCNVLSLMLIDVEPICPRPKSSRA
jgi:hypothetical protein